MGTCHSEPLGFEYSLSSTSFPVIHQESGNNLLAQIGRRINREARNGICFLALKHCPVGQAVAGGRHLKRVREGNKWPTARSEKAQFWSDSQNRA